MQGRSKKRLEKTLINKADKEDVNAQALLAYLYTEGKQGIEADPAKAFYWCKRAASHGQADMLFNLGVMCLQGIGTKHDEPWAVDCFQQAAVKGIPEAQFNLALMYHEGRSIEQDDIKAIRWLQKAFKQGYAPAKAMLEQWANQGVAPAQFMLAMMYAHGDGVDKNDDQAERWFEATAKQETLEAVDWFHREAKNEDAPARYVLARMYEQGLGVVQDAEQATYWYQQAAQLGYHKATQWCQQSAQ